MDIHEQHIVVLIDQLDGLVNLTITLDFYQTTKTAYTVVDMHNIVAHLQRIEFGNCHLLIALYLAIDTIATIAVKDLMVGIEIYLQSIIDKALIERDGYCIELHRTMT